MSASRTDLRSEADQAHWEAVYQTRSPEQVSWHQPVAGLSLDLVESLQLPPNTPLIDVGGGASTLVHGLVKSGFTDITVLDISITALEAARQRLGGGARVKWIRADLLSWQPDRHYDLWHDRALYHFLTDPEDRRTYRRLVNYAVSPEGYVVLITFSPDGPDRCSGLPVARYSPEDLTRELGPEFRVVQEGREEHITPSGTAQPFTWVVARKLAEAT